MIHKVGIIGAGTMGAGIAQLCLQRGFRAMVFDNSPEAMCKASGRIKQGLDGAVARSKMSAQDAADAMQKLSFAKKLEDLSNCDLIIEAVSEDLNIKRQIFETLSQVGTQAVVATNTSSLSMATLAKFYKPSENFLGLHFFNPPVMMKLVEVIRAPQTSEAAFKMAWDFAGNGLGRVPVLAKDTPGFIVNRVMRPYYLEGQKAALAGCGIAPLDEAAKKICGVPLGPFELMDLIGLDVNLSITKVIYEACGKPERFKPIFLQEKLVAAGALGRKTGRGFYLYRNGKAAGENPEALALIPESKSLSPEAGWERVIGAVIAEAKLAHEEGVASEADIDTAVKLAMNFPKGPFEWRQESAAK